MSYLRWRSVFGSNVWANIFSLYSFGTDLEIVVVYLCAVSLHAGASHKPVVYHQTRSNIFPASDYHCILESTQLYCSVLEVYVCAQSRHMNVEQPESKSRWRHNAHIHVSHRDKTPLPCMNTDVVAPTQSSHTAQRRSQQCTTIWCCSVYSQRTHKALITVAKPTQSAAYARSLQCRPTSAWCRPV